MEIVFLGTSAAIPTARRNTSATAIVRSNEILLFDCGEGTQMQFQKAGLRPGKLSKIFISHFHGDHLYGLIGFLTTLQLSGRTEPLTIYGPAGIADYLNYMKCMGCFEFNYPVGCIEVNAENPAQTWEFDSYAITCMPLQHRIFTLGYRLQEKPLAGKFDVQKAEILGIAAGPDRTRLQRGEVVETTKGRKVHPEEVIGPSRPGRIVAVCLDTQKCDSAVTLARDADLLIHEATFDTSREHLAVSTGHATALDAAETARKANVHKLVLTHISARFNVDDEPILLEEACKIFQETVIAEDLMRIDL
jgi:ribonuclease Z